MAKREAGWSARREAEEEARSDLLARRGFGEVTVRASATSQAVEVLLSPWCKPELERLAKLHRVCGAILDVMARGPVPTWIDDRGRTVRDCWPFGTPSISRHGECVTVEWCGMHGGERVEREWTLDFVRRALGVPRG